MTFILQKHYATGPLNLNTLLIHNFKKWQLKNIIRFLSAEVIKSILGTITAENKNLLISYMHMIINVCQVLSLRPLLVFRKLFYLK